MIKLVIVFVMVFLYSSLFISVKGGDDWYPKDISAALKDMEVINPNTPPMLKGFYKVCKDDEMVSRVLYCSEPIQLNESELEILAEEGRIIEIVR